MSRFEYQEEMIHLLDNACDELSSDEFKRFLERIEEEIENYR